MHYSTMRSGAFEFSSSMLRRLSRIYPLHILTIAYYAVLILALGQTTSLQRVDRFAECAIPQALLLHSFWTVESHCMNYPSWFISAFVAMSLVYPIARWTIVRHGVVPISVVVASAVIGLQIASGQMGKDWTTWSYDLGVLRAIPTFLAGVVLASEASRLGAIFPSFSVGYMASAASIVGMVLGWPSLITQILLQVVIVASLVGAELNGKESPLRSKFVPPFADLSLTIFLIHVPVASIALSFIAVRIFGLNGYGMLAAILATMILTIMLAWLINRITSLAAERLGGSGRDSHAATRPLSQTPHLPVSSFRPQPRISKPS